MQQLFLFIFLSLFACQQSHEDGLYGKVIHVSDGDSITLLINGKQQKVRLYGIDCPEYKQDFSNVAKKFTADNCFQQSVQLEIMDTDTYGRKVGIVHLANGKVLNEELLKAGLAWHYTHFDQSKKYADLEKQAREKKIGIWSMNRPLEPWNFRRQQRRN